MKVHRFVAGLFGYELIKHRKLNDTLEQHLRNVIRNRAINLVVDVGANRGQYGRSLRLHGYAGRIVSFEPVASAFDDLTALTKLDPAWFSYDFALGKTRGTQQINVYAASEFSSLLQVNDYARERFGWRTDAVGREAVEIRTLDELWADVCKHLSSPRALLKLDTQGYDAAVLAGSTHSLQFVHAIQIEISLKPVYDGAPRYLEVLSDLERLGFEVTGMYAVSRDKDSLAIVEYDCVMTRSREITDE